MPDQRLIDEIIAGERFEVEVMALTGWDHAAAKRLHRRLARIACYAPRASLASLRKRWRERYCEGWAYSGPRKNLIRKP